MGGASHFPEGAAGRPREPAFSCFWPDCYPRASRARHILAKPLKRWGGGDRVRWEHIQRVYEQCDRNVSETARRLNMHRRTLQRILNKYAPRERES